MVTIWRQSNAFKLRKRTKIRNRYNHKPPPSAPRDWGYFCSKVVVLLLQIHCFMYFLLFVGVLCFVFVLYPLLCIFSSFAIIMTRENVLVVLHNCLYGVLFLLFLTVPWVGIIFTYCFHMFDMFSCLFFTALWSPAGKGLPSWQSCAWCFVVFLSLSHVVSYVRCCTWLYLFLIFVSFLTLFPVSK